MKGSAALLLLLAACGGAPADCPSGAVLDSWQVISDSRSNFELICRRQEAIHLANYGSVWISSTDYRHDLGIAILTAAVRSDCPALDVRMSVSTTTKSVPPQGDIYQLSADTLDPWLVAIGVLSDVACSATIDSVSITKAATP